MLQSIAHIRLLSLQLSNEHDGWGGGVRAGCGALFVDELIVESCAPDDGDNSAENGEVVEGVIPKSVLQMGGHTVIALEQRIFLLNLDEGRVNRALLHLLRYFASGRSSQRCTPDSQDLH